MFKITATSYFVYCQRGVAPFGQRCLPCSKPLKADPGRYVQTRRVFLLVEPRSTAPKDAEAPPRPAYDGGGTYSSTCTRHVCIRNYRGHTTHGRVLTGIFPEVCELSADIFQTETSAIDWLFQTALALAVLLL